MAKNSINAGEMVTISCSGPGELYEVLSNGTLAPVVSASYRADEETPIGQLHDRRLFVRLKAGIGMPKGLFVRHGGG